MPSRTRSDEIVCGRCLSGGPPLALGLEARGLQDVRMHPDGRRVAMTIGDGRNEFWMLSGFIR